MRDRMSEIFWHPVTAASRAPRFPTTWLRNDGLWGRECGRAITSRMRTAEPLTAEVGAKQSIKRQLYTTHVGAFGWEPHSSSTTTWAGKVDHELKYYEPFLPRQVLYVPAPHNTCGSCWLGIARQFSTTCAGKADHGFGVCVPLTLICLLKIMN